MHHRATEDKTVIQLETENSKFEVNTLYKIIRGLEAKGFTQLSMSWVNLERPSRQPGEPDRIQAPMIMSCCTMPYHVMLTYLLHL